MAIPSPELTSGLEVYWYTLEAPPVASATKRARITSTCSALRFQTGSQYLVARQTQLAGGDEIDRVEALHQLDVGVGAHLVDQGELHRLAGGVGRVEDAAMAVAPSRVR